MKRTRRVARKQGFDRRDLTDKTRVHALAKNLDMTSKELIAALDAIGLVKVAQSSLSREEAEKVLDHLERVHGAAAHPGAESADAAETAATADATKAEQAPAEEAAAEKPASTRRRRATKSTKAAKETGAAEAKATKAAKKTTKKSTKSAKATEASQATEAVDAPEAAEAGSSEAAALSEEKKPAKKAARKTRSTRTTRSSRAKKAAEVTEATEGADAAEAVEVAETASAVTAAATEDVAAAPSASQKRRARRRATKKTSADTARPAVEPVPVDRNSVIVGVDEEAVEAKLRSRVEKNVANEIHQIEQKVEQELFAQAVEAEKNAELLEEVVPAITPPPLKPAFVPPVFIAPELPSTDVVDPADAPAGADAAEAAAEGEDEEPTKGTRRRGGRGRGRGKGSAASTTETSTSEDAPAEDEDVINEPVGIRGSTRLEAQRRRRSEMRESGRRKRHILSEAEFLARRESVERTMVVRDRRREDHPGLVTQVAVLEDDLLVEHFVTSETQSTMVGNIYLGKVQNVLPSMEAAFIDIGKGRNGVLYAGEVDWRKAGLGGRKRKIEQALKAGDSVLVQVTKDPIGQKGARLSTNISLAGRFLVYVPGGHTGGISRKLPEPERKRLKGILRNVMPKSAGAIIRTAAEGVSEEEITADVNRLRNQWEQINQAVTEDKESNNNKPLSLYEEPDMLVKVVRDLFNEDFSKLIIEGRRAWNTVHAYIKSVAPDLLERVEKYDAAEHNGEDVFAKYRIDEQLEKALSRKVWLPSGGTLVIDRTEAMTVIDVNTGKFTGAGGNLEETVTKNNLEAAEEIVRQMRLRDLGGMIVVDFIDMVLPENRDLVLRRLKEALGRDRTRHQVSEVTSLGLVQMTRKRLGTGLIETFATQCEHCDGRGLIIHADPVEQAPEEPFRKKRSGQKHPVAEAMRNRSQHNNELTAGEHADADAAKNAADERAQDAQDTQLEDTTAKQEREQSRNDEQGSRRSSRRRSSRSSRSKADDAQELPAERKPKTDAEQLADAVVAIAVDAVNVADEHDPDEPSGADYLPAPSMTYEQALEEYENSPRRKRAVRGNSRSDVPPKPEDYAPSNAGAVGSKSASADKAVAEEAPAEVVEESKPKAKGRRRATKKTTAKAAQSAPSEKIEKTEKVSKADQAAEEAEPAAEVAEEKPRTRSRRGRRVVKKTSSATAVQQERAVEPAAEPSASAAEPAGESSAPAADAAADSEEKQSGRRSSAASRRRRRATKKLAVETAGQEDSASASSAEDESSASAPDSSSAMSSSASAGAAAVPVKRATRRRVTKKVSGAPAGQEEKPAAAAAEKTVKKQASAVVEASADDATTQARGRGRRRVVRKNTTK